MGWLIALGILILLGCLPLGVLVRYNQDGFVLKAVAGPITIPILPKEEKAKKKADKKKTEKKSKPKQKASATAKEEPAKKGGSVKDFIPLVQVALELLNGLRKKIRIDRLELKVILAGDDPCDLATNYGRAWQALGNLMPQLERCFVIKKRDLEVECDFEASQTLIIADAKLTITLGRALGLILWYGVKALKEFLKLQNKRKGGATQ